VEADEQVMAVLQEAGGAARPFQLFSTRRLDDGI
jgi:hypothetical protein